MDHVNDTIPCEHIPSPAPSGANLARHTRGGGTGLHTEKHMAEDGESAAPPAYAEMDFPEERRTSLKAAFEKAAKEGRVEHKEVRCVCVRPEDLCPQG